jgi:hypothetical protein
MDKLTICDRCGSDACYIQEVTPEITNHFCYGCGFQSNTLMTEGSEFMNQQAETLPELYKDLLFKDETGKIWMPSGVADAEKGMIFAYGTTASDWRWAAVKAIKRTKEDKKKNPNLKTEYKMDMANQVYFTEKDFMEALDYIGLLTA